MLDLSIRQIKLLDHLLHNEVSHIDDLLSYVQISSRTLQSEITSINHELARAQLNIVINSNRTHGYSAEPNNENREVYERLKHQCRSYINSEYINRYGDNPRIAYLIRKLLCASEYVKAEDLVDELSISNATLTNDLRFARMILERYDIQLVSTPYYGMKVTGLGSAIRSCLIDLCDVYDIYEDSFFFQQAALLQYHIDSLQLKELRATLVSCLQKMNIQLQEQGFLIVLFDLLIVNGGCEVGKPSPIQFTDKQSSPYQCASVLCNYYHIQDPLEIEYLAALIAMFADNVDESVLKDASFSYSIYTLSETLIHKLKSQIHLNLAQKTHIVPILEHYLYSFLMKKTNHIYVYNNLMNQIDIVRNLPVSNSLALEILEVLKEETGYAYDEHDVISLTIQLFNAIFVVPNEYHMVHVAFIGPFSADTTVSVGYRMSMDERHNVHKDFYTYHDVEHIDFTKYDCVFVASSPGLRLNIQGPEIFYIDYFYHYETSNSFFQQVLAKHRIENFLLYKTDNKIEVNLSNKEHQYQTEIVDHLRSYGYESPYAASMIQYLIEQNALFYQMDPFVICLMWKKELAHTLFTYHLEQEEMVAGMRISQIQIVIMDPNDNVLAVKQADSYVRRMQQRCVL